MIIPDFIEESHVRKAIKALDGGHQIPPRRKAKKYALLVAQKKYPPKYVVSLAHSFASPSGKELRGFKGGAQTNNFLIALGFVVVDRIGKPLAIAPVDEDEESSFPEGKEAYRLHRKLERDGSIGKKAKTKRLQETADLACDVCGFSFQYFYGPRGVGYIEAHHCVPVSELKGKKRTKLSDIALVCSNCHRMLHHSRPWLKTGELRKLARSKSQSPNAVLKPTKRRE